MPYRSDRKVDHWVGIDGVPGAIAQQDNSWKIIKDVIRNLIDGQPKKVDLRRSVFWCLFQCNDDLIQAYEALKGRSWYDVVHHGNGRVPHKMMEVTCFRVHSNHLVEKLQDPSQHGQERRRLSTASHTRTSSTSSTSSSYIWTPVSPGSISNGLLPPSSSTSSSYMWTPISSGSVSNGPLPPHDLMPHYHISTQVPMGSFTPASITPRVDNVGFVPAPAMVPVNGYKIANPVGCGTNPSGSLQFSNSGRNLTHQSLPRATAQRRQIIVQNLHVDVKEHWLKTFFTKSVGPVQECRIEERGDKKRHALVSFTHAEHAQAAMNQFNGESIAGRKVYVRLTKEIQEGPVIIDGSGVCG